VKLIFELPNTVDNSGVLKVKRISGDREISPGWKQHGDRRAFANRQEITNTRFMNAVKVELKKAGIALVAIDIRKDGHLLGFAGMKYLRPPLHKRRKSGHVVPHIYIVDGDYAIRDAIDDYNSGYVVRLDVYGDVFQDYRQPEWRDLVRAFLKDAPNVKVINRINLTPKE